MPDWLNGGMAVGELWSFALVLLVINMVATRSMAILCYGFALAAISQLTLIALNCHQCCPYLHLPQPF